MALTMQMLAEAIRADATDAARLRPVVTQLVMDYAPGAPGPLRDEAVIRLAGYLLDMPPSPSGSGYANAMTNSGAAALLTAFKVRRAAAIRKGANG